MISKLEVNKLTGQLSISSQAEIDLILGYLKIYGFNPLDVDILQVISSNQEDLKEYLKSPKAAPQSRIIEGVNIPPSKEVETKIKDFLSTQLQFEVRPEFKKMLRKR